MAEAPGKRTPRRADLIEHLLSRIDQAAVAILFLEAVHFAFELIILMKLFRP